MEPCGTPEDMLIVEKDCLWVEVNLAIIICLEMLPDFRHWFLSLFPKYTKAPVQGGRRDGCRAPEPGRNASRGQPDGAHVSGGTGERC